MLTKPDDQTLSAMMRIANEERFIAFLESELLAQSGRNNREKDDVLLRQGQGRAVFAYELIAAIKGAREALEPKSKPKIQGGAW